MLVGGLLVPSMGSRCVGGPAYGMFYTLGPAWNAEVLVELLGAGMIPAKPQQNSCVHYISCFLVCVHR